MCPRLTTARDRLRRLFAAALGALCAVFLTPSARAAETIPVLVEASAHHDDNLGRATRPADKRGDTAVRLGVSAENARVLGRDWLLSGGLASRGEHWLEFERFDTADFEARLALRRRFGLGPTAPALRLALAGGPRVARDDDRSGWTGLASLEFTHRPWTFLRYSFAAEGERIDTRDTFYDITGRTFSGELAFFPSDRWTLSTGVASRFGNVLAFSSPPPTWRFLSPYLSAVPLRRGTDFFDVPLNAYNLEASTAEGSVSVSYALDDATRLTLGFAYADTRRDGLRYLNRTVTAGVARRF